MAKSFNLAGNKYYRLAGHLSVGDRDPATGTLLADSLLPLGDNSEFNLEFNQEFFEKPEYNTGEGRIAVRTPVQTSGTASITLDNFSAQTLKKFIQGNVSAHTGATQTAEPHTAPSAGKSFLLNNPVSGSSSVVITDSSASTTYVEGVDYQIVGRQVLVESGSAMASSAVIVTYDSASSQKVGFFATPYKELYLFFNGINTLTNERTEVELFKWAPDPAAFDGLIKDEITRLPVAGQCLYEQKQDTAANTYGGFGTITLLD